MDFDEIAESLRNDYVMIPKDRWWFVLSGVATFFVATGIVSYQSALKVVEDSAAADAVQAIEELRGEAQDDRNTIGILLAGSSAALNEMNGQLEAMSTLEQSLADIRTVIERGNPWEQFSDNIKDIDGTEKEHLRYEYAVWRNDGFRTLTISGWNGGRRVMTSPYMTGDWLPSQGNPSFKVGGSMWIWDTLDPADDDGVFHLYYYADGGSIESTGSGNGLTGAEQGGEGYFYRRLRK